MLFLTPFEAKFAIYDRLLSTTLKLVFCYNMLFYLLFPGSALDVNLRCQTLSNAFLQTIFFLPIEAVLSQSSGQWEKYGHPCMSPPWLSQSNLPKILYLHSEKFKQSIKVNEQIKQAIRISCFIFLHISGQSTRAQFFHAFSGKHYVLVTGAVT